MGKTKNQIERHKVIVGKVLNQVKGEMIIDWLKSNLSEFCYIEHIETGEPTLVTAYGKWCNAQSKEQDEDLIVVNLQDNPIRYAIFRSELPF